MGFQLNSTEYQILILNKKIPSEPSHTTREMYYSGNKSCWLAVFSFS